MTDKVLAKKLRQSGIARSPLAETDIIVESLVRGIEDQLRPLVKTTTNCTMDTVGVTKLAQATAGMPPPAMYGVVEIEDSDTPALVSCDGALANHFIDLTLGGDPLMAPAGEPRNFTPIDTALCRLHLDAVIAAFVHAMGVGLGRPLNKRIRIREQRHNHSQLRLAPDYIDVLAFEMSISLGEGGRTGRLGFVLPLSALDVIRASVQAKSAREAKERPNDLWRTLMRRAAASAPVRVDAVLHRQTLSLSALQALRVGQVLEIPRSAVDEIGLTIPQPGDRTAVMATGQLGAFQDRKVIRLVTPPDSRVIRHIERALHAGTQALPGPTAPPRPAAARDATARDATAEPAPQADPPPGAVAPAAAQSGS